MEHSDKELIAAIKAGDTSKMGILYEKYNQDLYAYFFRMTNDRSKSEDLVHNVFFRMIKYAHNFKGDGKFVYWMFSIARNIWIDDYRKANPLRNVKTLDQIDHQLNIGANNVADSLEYKERKTILKYALDQIGPEKKEAIVLSRFHEMKYKDIAILSNCTENTIKSRIKRGIVELQQIVQQLEAN